MKRVFDSWFRFPASRSPLEIGEEIPRLRCSDQDGAPVDLAEAAGEGWALVYFYPKARTPGCTLQACSLRNGRDTLEELGVKVFGVSMDTASSQKRFHEKRGLTFTLIADPEKKVIDAFGVPTLLGVARRMAFLFRDGALVWRDLRASTWNQAADVIDVVRGRN